MAPQRLCKDSTGCTFPAMKGRQRCAWHWLAKQPAHVQANAAEKRRARVPLEARRPRVAKERWPAGGRWCAGCQSMIPLFYARGSRCIACASSASHGAAIKKAFDIDSAEYARLLELQGGRCAICRNRPRAKRLAVDHDHQTGAVRGLLCKRCNHDLLGAAHDDARVLRAAIAYLEAPPAVGETYVGGLRRQWAPPESESAQRNDGPPPF